MYSSGEGIWGGACKRAPAPKKKNFFFGDLRPREPFFLFTKIFSSEIYVFSVRPPYPQACKLVAFNNFCFFFDAPFLEARTDAREGLPYWIDAG